MKNKHTPGPYKKEIWNYTQATPAWKQLIVQSEQFRIAVLDCDFSGGNPFVIPREQAEANADLIVEAFNVLHETGLTPRQLAEHRTQLTSALRRLLDCPALNMDDLEPEDHLAIIQARATLMEVSQKCPSSTSTTASNTGIQFSPCATSGDSGN